MAEGFWNREQPISASSGMLKRPRSEYDLPPSGVSSSYEMHNQSRDGYNTGLQPVRDTKTIDSAYELYLQNQINSTVASREASSYGSGDRLGGRAGGGRLPVHAPSDQGILGRPRDFPDLSPNNHGTGFGGGLPTMDAMARPNHERAPLPRDASDTLYVEGLPSNSTKREVSHIFRPFVGYKEVRIVTKESKSRGGEPLLLCFVDFINPACAATALMALQGYKMDEHDPNSAYLRLQFSRSPGPKSGPGYRGKR